MRETLSPWLFSYDMHCPRRARRVLRCLRKWRLDGQLSIHETWLKPQQAEDLAVELLELVDRRQDHLMLCRLRRFGTGPIWVLARGPRATPTVTPEQTFRFPQSPSQGWYLVTYDIQDPRRLRQVHRLAAAQCAFVQRSVYLYAGSGEGLLDLAYSSLTLLRSGQDDLRIYSLSGPEDLWVLSGDSLPLTTFPTSEAGAPPWQRFIHWLKGHFPWEP